jgi:hypothetical protein
MAVTTTDRARLERVREVENALASVRMEGLEPSEQVKALFQRYVDGELDSRALDKALDAHFDREYGPIRLSRNERS